MVISKACLPIFKIKTMKIMGIESFRLI
jgi:hypothetical protein